MAWQMGEMSQQMEEIGASFPPDARVRASMFDTYHTPRIMLFCIIECFCSANWPQVVANIDAQQVDKQVHKFVR